MKLKEIFSEMYEDAIEDVKDALEDYTGYYSDFHHEAFNSSYYTIDTDEAKNILGEYAFDAIGIVQQYEKQQFGEIYTDLGNPIKVCNMLYYIIGEEVLCYGEGRFSDLLSDVWCDEADEETNKKLLELFVDSIKK